MSELRLTVEEIQSLMDKMAETGLGQLLLEDGEFKLKLSAQREPVIMSAPAAPVSGAEPVQAAVQTPAVQEQPAEETGNVVKSPIIGTFYAAPSPDKDPFAPVGKQVKESLF